MSFTSTSRNRYGGNGGGPCCTLPALKLNGASLRARISFRSASIRSRSISRWARSITSFRMTKPSFRTARTAASRCSGVIMLTRRPGLGPRLVHERELLLESGVWLAVHLHVGVDEVVQRLAGLLRG